MPITDRLDSEDALVSEIAEQLLQRLNETYDMMKTRYFQGVDAFRSHPQLVSLERKNAVLAKLGVDGILLFHSSQVLGKAIQAVQQQALAVKGTIPEGEILLTDELLAMPYQAAVVDGKLVLSPLPEN